MGYGEISPTLTLTQGEGTRDKCRLGVQPNKNMTKKRDKLNSINLSPFLKIDAGIVLSSQEVALQVFSPLQVFTTVFGMGTGGLLAIGHQRILLHTLEIT